MTCEFSKMIKGEVISNKKGDTVATGILEKWCIGGPGYPKRSFHANNGGEFVNDDVRAACRRNDIKLTLSPSFSPWSNGGNERRHAVVDETVTKILADNPKLSLQQAVDYACFARNNEIGPLGWSPHQIVYGQGSAIPGITDGNIATDLPISDSEAVFNHFRTQQEARKAFLEADSSMRIKKCLKS